MKIQFTQVFTSFQARTMSRYFGLLIGNDVAYFPMSYTFHNSLIRSDCIRIRCQVCVRNLFETMIVTRYKTLYLCHLDPYTVTMWYWVPSHCPSITVQLPTRYFVARFLHILKLGNGYPVQHVSDVVIVQ